MRLSSLKLHFDVEPDAAHCRHAVDVDSLVVVARREDQIGIERRSVVDKKEVADHQRHGHAAEAPPSGAIPVAAAHRRGRVRATGQKFLAVPHGSKYPLGRPCVKAIALAED